LTTWCKSNDAFLVFFLELRDGGRAGSITAKDVDHLLADVLPTLFQEQFMPPAKPGFGVAAREAHRIWTEVERLKPVASASPGPRH
jgi:hypothetical protein